MAQRIHFYKIILLLSFLSFTVYGNHLENSFHFDGIEFIIQNPKIKDINHISHVLTKVFTQRSLTQTSFVLNYYFGQHHPFGYHLFNLLLHTLNGILIYVLISGVHKAFSKNTSWTNTNYENFIPLCTAGLFVIHPIQTESVVYIISRSELLSAFFYLLAFVLFQYCISREKKVALRTLLMYSGVLLLFCMAIGSKRSAITFPFIAFLYYLFQTSQEAPIIRFLKKWRYAFTAIILVALFMLFRKLLTDEPFLIGPSNAGEVIGRKNYMLTEMFVVVFYYIKLLLFPINLNPDPDITMLTSIFDPYFFLPAIVLFSLSIWIFRQNRSKWLVFGFTWYIITVSPSSSIITLLDFAAEHRLYLPSAGIFAVFSYILSQIIPCKYFNAFKARISLFLIFGALITLFSIMTISRNNDWRSSLTLWKDTVEKSPKKGRPYMNLGYAYDEVGEIDEAIKSYKKATRFSYYSFKIYYNLGNNYLKKGRTDDALNEFHKALQSDSSIPETYSKLGEIYLEKHDFTKADFYLKKASEINPAMDVVFRNLGILHYYHLKNYKEAYLYFSRSLNINPNQNHSSEIRNLVKSLKKRLGKN